MFLIYEFSHYVDLEQESDKILLYPTSESIII